MNRAIVFLATLSVAAFGIANGAAAATCNEILKDETPVSLTEGDPTENVVIACGGEPASLDLGYDAASSSGSGGGVSTPPVVSSVSGGGATGFGGGGATSSNQATALYNELNPESTTVPADEAVLAAASADASVTAVPLPASGLLLLVGLGGVAALRKRKKS